jgi:hypothetical protein
MLLAAFLLMSGNPRPPERVYAQAGSPPLTEEQYREIQRKWQEQLNGREHRQPRQESAAQRLKKAVKRRQDAKKRQKEAEKRLRQLEQQPR